MALLGAIAYYPATAVTVSMTGSVGTWSAFDTTNLRLTFTAPSTGRVMVRLVGSTSSTGSYAATASFELGVMSSGTIVMGAYPKLHEANISALRMAESLFPVTGLTSGASVTWDAGYQVTQVQTSTNFGYGGGISSTTTSNRGPFMFEVYG